MNTLPMLTPIRRPNYKSGFDRVCSSMKNYGHSGCNIKLEGGKIWFVMHQIVETLSLNMTLEESWNEIDKIRSMGFSVGTFDFLSPYCKKNEIRNPNFSLENLIKSCLPKMHYNFPSKPPSLNIIGMLLMPTENCSIQVSTYPNWVGTVIGSASPYIPTGYVITPQNQFISDLKVCVKITGTNETQFRTVVSVLLPYNGVPVVVTGPQGYDEHYYKIYPRVDQNCPVIIFDVPDQEGPLNVVDTCVL